MSWEKREQKCLLGKLRDFLLYCQSQTHELKLKKGGLQLWFSTYYSLVIVNYV